MTKNFHSAELKKLLLETGREAKKSSSVVSDSLRPHGLPGSSVHGISQARTLEWVAISFSRGSSRPRYQTWVSYIAADSLPSKPPGKPSRIGGIPYLFKIFLVNIHTDLWTIFTQAMFIISQISVLISKAVKNL